MGQQRQGYKRQEAAAANGDPAPSKTKQSTIITLYAQVTGSYDRQASSGEEHTGCYVQICWRIASGYVMFWLRAFYKQDSQSRSTGSVSLQRSLGHRADQGATDSYASKI